MIDNWARFRLQWIKKEHVFHISGTLYLYYYITFYKFSERSMEVKLLAPFWKSWQTDRPTNQPTTRVFGKFPYKGKIAVNLLVLY